MSSPQLAPRTSHPALPKDRSPLAHLLHALNQPLTGLQCSLELALAGPRSSENYVRTLRDGLELTGRMRVLVEAIHELADAPSDAQDSEAVLLDTIVRETAGDLIPVADAKRVRLQLFGENPLPVQGGRRRLLALLFRFLESALSLAQDGSELRIVSSREQNEASLAVSWNQGPLPEFSPFSRQELGLLIAQAGWEQLGAAWTASRGEAWQKCTIRLPIASSTVPPRPLIGGGGLQ